MIGLPLDRRTFLAGLGASMLSRPTLSAENTQHIGDTVFVSAYRDPSGAFGIALLDEFGDILFQEALPARGHGAASHSGTSKVIMFARRPGNFALALDLTFQNPPQLFRTRLDRHFYGHGTFSEDGTLLYATENDFDGAKGVIGIYDARHNFRRIGEFPSGGVGPHDILLMNDGTILCTANGGIETHPEFGRQKLNLDRMQSNICFIDAVHGDVLAVHPAPKEWSRLSMRHLACDQKNQVWFGGQYEGNEFDQAPIIGSVSLSDGVNFLNPERLGSNGLRNYIGSVASHQDGLSIAFSAPKSGQVIVINPIERSIIRSIAHPRACGIAPIGLGEDAHFMLSSEHGTFGKRRHQYDWDNHIGTISC